MHSAPLVSILINNYNYANFLGEAIESALHQTYPNTEIIVVDDGSNDNSREIINNYGSKINPILKDNGGQASAFNAGFLQSQGELIVFLDADDIFVPDKLEKLVEIFTQNSNIGWCFHPLKLVDLDLDNYSFQHPIFPEKGGSAVYDITSDMRQGKLRGKLPFPGTVTSGLAFKRNLLAQLLPMPEEIRITSDDYLKYGAFGLMPGYVLLENLALQRIHGNNLYTFQEGDQKKALQAKIELLTAYWLKHHFPCMQKFSNNLFASSWSKYQKLDHTSSELQNRIDEYLSRLNFPEKLEVNLRSLYYGLRR